MANDFPSQARVVIIGGGVIGCSVAYHLAKRGWKDVASEIFFAKVERTAPTVRPEWAGSRVKAYRSLGRTGVKVSDISLGSGAITRPPAPAA